MKATKIKIRLRSTWLPGQNVQVWRVKALGDEKKGSTVRELPGDGNIETPQTWSSAGIVNRKISYSVDGCLESWILFIKCSIHYMFYFLRCLHVTTFLKREKENTMRIQRSPSYSYIPWSLELVAVFTVSLEVRFAAPTAWDGPLRRCATLNVGTVDSSTWGW